MAENGKYIYGILNSNTNLQLTIPKAFLVEDGESAAAVYTIPYQDLSALVRDSNGDGSLPTSKEALALIQKGLLDKDPAVRLEALTVIRNLPGFLSAYKEKLLRRTGKTLKRETDPDVKLALALLTAP